MSSNKTSIENLSAEIMKQLTEYKEDIEEDVITLANKNIKEASEYAKSWSTKNGKKLKEVYSKIVYNKEFYRLTHLLEFGHALRNGKRFEGKPHIRKTEEKYRNKYINELEMRIRIK